MIGAKPRKGGRVAGSGAAATAAAREAAEAREAGAVRRPRRPRRRGGVFVPLLVLLLLAAAAYGAFSLVTALQRGRIATLEDSILALQAETVPLRFMVTERRDGRIDLRYRLYDLAGEEYAAAELSLQGETLYLDFLALPRGDAWLAFPYRIFTERVAPAAGAPLFDAVMGEGRPRSHRGGPFGEAELLELGRLYAALIAGEPVRSAFGNAVHDLAELRRFELGVVYKVVARKKGGIEILEE